MNHALLQHVIDFSLRQSIQHCISNSAKQQTILTLHFVKGVRYVNRLLLYADISKLIDALYREDHCLILWQIQEIRLCIQTIYHKVPGQIVIYLYHSFITAYHCNLHTIPPYAIVCRKQAFAIRKAVCAWK